VKAFCSLRGVRRAGRGFALVEAAMLIIAVALIACFLLIAGQQSRHAGLLGQDMAKMRELGAGTYAFALDNQDRLWTFDWQPNVNYNTPWPELNIATTHLQAAVNQAVYIMRSRGYPHVPRPSGWIPHVLYSHLVLADYLDKPLPWHTVISAADVERQRWVDNLNCPGCVSPCNAPHLKTALASSFSVTAGWFDRSPVGSRVSQGAEYNFFLVPQTAIYGPGRLSDVAFPVHKVALHDVWSRHSGYPVPLYNDPAARLPLLHLDGHARVRHTSNANPGWQPNMPMSQNPTVFPSMWRISECIPGIPGMPAQIVPGQPAPGVYRWTRGGLAGRDFGGAEINTGQTRGVATHVPLRPHGSLKTVVEIVTPE
jgi:hypothetical protein